MIKNFTKIVMLVSLSIIIMLAGCDKSLSSEEVVVKSQDKEQILSGRLAEDNLLPLGSIVDLGEGESKLMIIGRVQSLVDNDKVYDYSSCLYPNGLMGASDSYLFDHDMIKQLYYIGYEDEQEGEYQKLLEENGY